MNSGRRWTLRVAKRVAKRLRKFPAADRDRIIRAIEELQTNPFQGDIIRLSNQPSAWRRRIAAYRIFFDVDAKQGLVDIVDIVRRSSTTY